MSRVKREPDHRQWVGGRWQQMQEFQMNFLSKCEEFSKEKRFLDLGCGSMRLGSKLIEELDVEKYIGLDFNEKIVRLGIEKEVKPDVVEEKKPTFIFNSNFDLSDVEGKIDFVWVYQVFIHVNDELVETAIKNISDKLTDDGVVYASFVKSIPKISIRNSYVYDHAQLTFFRTPEKIKEIFANSGLSFEKVGMTPGEGGIIVKGTKL